MNVLHYTLGLPPIRTGGLVNFVLDYINNNKEDKNILLWPGELKKGCKTKIVEDKSTKEVKCFRIVNPLPVIIFNSAKDLNLLIEPRDADCFEKMLIKFDIEVLHIHTFMGLPISFLEVAKKLGIKIIFTTHDYYGLCPKTILYNKNGKCDGESINCSRCISSPLTTRKIKLLQSKLYLCLRRVIKLKHFGKKIKAESELLSKGPSYELLSEYYKEMFRYIDYFHFNSFVAKSVYEKKLGKLKGEVIPLFSNLVKSNNVVGFHNDININFIGGANEYKGLEYLINCIDECDSKIIKLHVYGIKVNHSNVICHPKYNPKNVNIIMESCDALIIPSLWNETFGLGTLEALACNRPVIASSNVGSKMIIDSSYGWVYDTKMELIQLLKKLKLEDIIEKSKMINENYKPLDYNLFNSRIRNLYKKKGEIDD